MANHASHLITVALRMAGIAGQDKLNGIFEYLSEGHRWQLSIYRTADEFTADAVRRELARGAEGFIVGIPGADDALAVLAETQLPTVLMNVSGGGIEKRHTALAYVRSDSSAIGSTAAEELLKQGCYKSFAFAGYRTDADWSRTRGEAFRARLAKAGFAVHAFDRAHHPYDIDDPQPFADWLASLPKPCGLFAACDDRAFESLDACTAAGLDVPRDIGILGVNNDPILCENAEPRLSSVQPDFIREGHLAAVLLDHMISRAAYAAQQDGTVHTVGVRRVVHRDSTRPLSEAGLLVQKALGYIEKNALKGISVQDVARHVKVSYSLLNLRFCELQGQPLYETILARRRAHAEHLLTTTDQPIESIALACGWCNAASMKTYFRRHGGISPQAWRNQQPKSVRKS